MHATISTKSKYLAFAAVMIGIAAPVSAALWQVPGPATGLESMDLARFDDMTRIGVAQTATDPYCDIRETVLINLTESYGENQKLSERRTSDTRLDLWASDASGTWTAIYTRADGIACVIGSGVNWTLGMSPAKALEQAAVAL